MNSANERARSPDGLMPGVGRPDRAIGRVLRAPMRYEIVAKPRYVRADLFHRHTTEETAEFLNAVATECIRLQCYRVLISVRASKPIFTLEKYGFSSFIELALRYPSKFALLADSTEVRIAHEYAVMLARLRGVNVRTFRDEAAAVEWLENGKQ